MVTRPPVLAPCKSACTWRKVSGNMGSVPAFLSAALLASTMPKGAAENLAKGGMPPVATASGKPLALANVRPDSSLTSDGNLMLRRAFSGSGGAKRTSVKVAPFSSLSSLGAMTTPCAVLNRAPMATERGTGAEKRSTRGRRGKQGALARSRSQENSAVKRGRTVQVKVLATAETIGGSCAEVMPAPHTMRTLLSGAKARSQRASNQLAAGFSSRCSRNSCSRCGPVTTCRLMRSPRTSTSHQAFLATLAMFTAPFRRSKKCWSSSMAWPTDGRVCTTLGAPVLKRNSCGPSSGATTGPTSGFQFGATRSVQLMPNVNGSGRSKTHCLSLSQRESPAMAWPLHDKAKGAGKRGSPAATTGTSNRRLTWRTSPTLPCGLITATRADCAGMLRQNSAAMTLPTRHKAETDKRFMPTTPIG